MRSLKLVLADGRQWVIHSLDEETAAIVVELGKVMRLGPVVGTDRPSREGRELCVSLGDESVESCPSDADVGGPVVLGVHAPTDRDMLVAQMMRIAETIAREALSRGGMLLHGALAEHRGNGFVMAGPGTIGKSTASRRLPLPWHSLCDDTTLVVRDDKGQHWAHPWPTWSLFWSGGPGGSWPVEQAVPLRAVFFLGQALVDKLEPVTPTQATAILLESDIGLVRAASSPVSDLRSSVPCGIRAARSLAGAVPAYSLQLSLGGRFWEEIERVLPKIGVRGQKTEDRSCVPVVQEQARAEDSPSERSRFADVSLRIVCTGTSMNPTLQERDLLKVRPYESRHVRRGDVVCFKSRDTGRIIVHRVVSVGRRRTDDEIPTGSIRTRGDNNLTEDPWVLQARDVIGRVTASQRGARRWVIAGGWYGLAYLRCVRLGQAIRKHTGIVPHTLYECAARLGPFTYLLPRSLHPRLVRFDARYRVFLKLLMGRRTVGQYDDWRNEWRIQRPFRLFVHAQALPDPLHSPPALDSLPVSAEPQSPNPNPPSH